MCLRKRLRPPINGLRWRNLLLRKFLLPFRNLLLRRGKGLGGGKPYSLWLVREFARLLILLKMRAPEKFKERNGDSSYIPAFS